MRMPTGLRDLAFGRVRSLQNACLHVLNAKGEGPRVREPRGKLLDAHTLKHI